MTDSRPENSRASSPPFTLRTLGAADLRAAAAGAERRIPLVGKQFALVAYLACAPDRSASRATLLDLFAPAPSSPRDASRSEKRAGDAVRNLLQQVRAKLGVDVLGSLRSDPIQLHAQLW